MMKKGALRKLIVALLLCSIQASVSFSQDGSRFDLRKLEELRLTTSKGQSAPIRCSGKKGYLFVFLSPECPLCKNYAPVLNRLYTDYDTVIRFFGIVPGRSYTVKEVNTYAAEYNIPFSLFVDKQKKLSQYLSARVTPEVVLMDDTGTVIYRGAIDDWVAGLGKKKLHTGVSYLQNALVQYLNDQPVLTKHVPPKGCLINDY
jgi:thiol-disulfide isomerase/thioredoxin